MSTTTSAPTLTDRYVYAVLRALPEAKRADIDRELRASLADAVDARVDNGEPAAEAERAALLELGDPARLAASYVGRPLTLIGPALYVDYVRVLRALLLVVLPIVLVVLVALNAIAGASLGGVIGTAVTTVLTVGVHMCFWTTLAFVVLERTGNQKPLLVFDPAALPAIPVPTGVKLSDVAANVVFGLFLIGALVWQQTASVFRDPAGVAIPILDPALWGSWLPYLIVLAVLTIVHALLLYRVGRWTWSLFAGVVVLNVAAVAPLVGLLVTGGLFNPEFLARLSWAPFLQPGSTVVTVIVAVLVLSGLGAIADAAVKTVRAQRS